MSPSLTTCTCPSRRRFLVLASGCLLCGPGGATRLKAAGGRSVEIGTLADFPADVISEKFIQHDFFVIRHAGKLFACTATCPHKANGLLVDATNPAQIICSGHESKFSPEGIPLRGPARRPLVRYAIAIDPNGRISVDPSREFARAQWSEAASFVSVGGR